MPDTPPSPKRLFKKLTPKNWQKRDRTANHFVRIHKGRKSPISNDQWAAIILKTQLSENVPQDVRNLFEVAQSVLCYGCFFYPLFTLGCEQFYRVLEAALKHRCATLSAPKKVKTFAQMTAWLRDQGHMNAKRFGQWEAGRNLRNSSSHSGRQSLIDPPTAVCSVEITAELIEELFAIEDPMPED